MVKLRYFLFFFPIKSTNAPLFPTKSLNGHINPTHWNGKLLVSLFGELVDVGLVLVYRILAGQTLPPPLWYIRGL
jgi:hypothetical protein